MLVLNRRPGERITINHKGESIDIVLVGARAGQGRIGFDGPDSFQVNRDDMIRGPKYNAVTDDLEPDDDGS